MLQKGLYTSFVLCLHCTATNAQKGLLANIMYSQLLGCYLHIVKCVLHYNINPHDL